MGSTWSAFFQVCLLSLLSSLHAWILSTCYEDHTPRTHTHLHNSPHRPNAIKSSPTHHTVSQFTPHKSLVNHVNPFLKIIRNSSVFRQKPIDKQGESEIQTWIKIWVNDLAATKAWLIARSWSANSGDEIQGMWSPTLDLLWRWLSRVILCVGLVFRSQGR